MTPLPLTARPAKLLIGFVGRKRGEALVAAAKSAGARGGTIALGMTQANNWLLEALSLADVPLDVVFVLMGDETDAVLGALEDAARDEPKKYAGMLLLLRVPSFFVRLANVAGGVEARGEAGADGGDGAGGADQAPSGASASLSERNDSMEPQHQLIGVVVNTGYANDVMAAARRAGATGGTILNARGTGTEEDVKFFGISLVPEKEMLFILADRSRVEGIVEAVCSVPNLSEPGGGIVFNLNVDRTILLGGHQPH